MTTLPVLATVATAYRLAWTHFGYLVRLSAGWAAITLGCLLLAAFAFGETLEDASDEVAASGAGPVAAVTLILFVGWIASTMMGIAVAVAAHRAYLMAETRDGYMAPLDARGGRFMVRSMILGLIGGAAALVVAVVVGLAAEFGEAAIALISMPLVIGIYLLIARLSPYLPAAALDDTTMTLREAFHLTEGIGWRIVAAFLLTMLPVGLAEGLLQQVAEAWRASAPLSGTIVLALVLWLGAVALGALAAGVLSQVYKAVRGDPMAVTPVPASS